MNNRRIKHVLKFFLSAFILIEFMDKYIFFLAPNLEYYFYNNNQEKYDIVEAYIERSDKIILIPGKFDPFVSIVKQEISYEINGEKYIEYIYTYPEMTQGEHIKIAYNIRDLDDIRRCMRYDLTSEDKVDIRITLMVIAMFLILYIVNEIYIKVSNKG